MDEEINKNIDGEDTQDPEAQKIIDKINSGEEHFDEADADVKLPSDENNGEEDSGNNDEPEALFAGKYKSVDDLKNGIKNLKTELPEYILNGMNDEALEKYYQEESKKFQQNKSKKYSTDDKKDEPKKDSKPNDDKPVDKNISQELWNELGVEFAENGGITEKQYEELDKLGIPDNIVDSYLDGLKAKQEVGTQKMHDIAGGKENLEKIKTWAEKNIPNSIARAESATNQEDFFEILEGIKARYELANGSTSKRIVGNKSSGKSGSYKSQDDYLRDVSDRRYNTDEYFRKAVDRKLANSKF